MEHVLALKSQNSLVSQSFLNKLTGKYYTPRDIASHLINALISQIANTKESFKEINLIDPFAGDGRLVDWLIQSWTANSLPDVKWNVTLWDINEEGLRIAKGKMNSLIEKGISLKYIIKSGDSFRMGLQERNSYDIVITNPPWELLKPDVRELNEIYKDFREDYIKSLKKYDLYLTYQFPKSQPVRKFAGWGTNLSRVGIEHCYQLCKDNRYVAIVIPASFFADDQSIKLRSEIMLSNQPIDIGYFPAEAKLFEKADVNSATLVFKKGLLVNEPLLLSIYDKSVKIKESATIKLDNSWINKKGCTIPVSLGAKAIDILRKLTNNLPSWSNLEHSNDGIWAGRELDETNSKNWLIEDGIGHKFIKGKMINRYSIIDSPNQYVNKANWEPPTSCQFERIVWRDVSRPNQKRRIIATIIPQGIIAGNSLGVAYFKDANSKALKTLLGIMNSMCFEFQLRCYLATGHISLSSIRKVCVPSKKDLFAFPSLEFAIEQALKNDDKAQFEIEARVAKNVYKLTKAEFSVLMDTFEKVTEQEKTQILIEYDKIAD